MRLAVAQVRTSNFQKEKNEEKILSLTRQARDEGADLVLFPEGSNLGYFILDKGKDKEELRRLAHASAPSLSSPWIDRLKQEAGQGIHIACGHFLRADDVTLVNSLVLVCPDGGVVTYEKTHLYHKKTIKEADFVQMGNGLVVADTSLGKIGFAICYDLNFPEVMRNLALKGAQIVLICAAWPDLAGKSWDMLLPARAFENQNVILASNQAGDGYYGHSKIVDYMGNVLVEFGREEGIRVVEVDLEKLKKWRSIVTFFDDRRPGLYH